MPRTPLPKFLLLLTALLAAVACAGILPELTPDSEAAFAARWPAAAATQMRTGRGLFVQRCSGCHTLPNPAKHDATGWEVTLDRMGSKAHLDSQGHEAVSHYLIFISEMRRTAQTNANQQAIMRK